jgi:dTDP-4-amino-4,6-dideoxygalactose transaminase
VRAALTEARIGTAVYYVKPLHLHPAHLELGEGPGSLPVCEAISMDVLSLPMHPDLDRPSIDRVCQTLLTVVE